MADGHITVTVNARADEVAALVAEVKRLRAELQYARDGLTKGRTRTREDLARLRAALAELLACHTEGAGFTMSMLADRAEFDAMLQRSQERLEAAVVAGRVALGPNPSFEPTATRRLNSHG